MPACACTTTLKFAVAPLASDDAVHVMIPVPPTAGVMHVHPAGTDIDWNVALAGIAVVNVG